jgi:DNA-binding GntR family transcriptional regulator
MLIEDIYQKIKEMIYFSELAPGQKLIYNDLAKKLGVSITPIVQALVRLEASHLVQYAPNKGYYVGEITEIEAKELYETREALETYIVPFVIRNLNKERHGNIKKIFKKHLNAKQNENLRGLILLDVQFHLKIAEYSKNEVIYDLLKFIFERIYLKYRPEYSEYMGKERLKQVIVEHREILAAFKQADVDKAILATRKHITHGMAYIIASLGINRRLEL